MVAIIHKSDLELNTLIAEHCDDYVWVTWDGMKGAPLQRLDQRSHSCFTT